MLLLQFLVKRVLVLSLGGNKEVWSSLQIKYRKLRHKQHYNVTSWICIINPRLKASVDTLTTVGNRNISVPKRPFQDLHSVFPSRPVRQGSDRNIHTLHDARFTTASHKAHTQAVKRNRVDVRVKFTTWTHIYMLHMRVRLSPNHPVFHLELYWTHWRSFQCGDDAASVWLVWMFTCCKWCTIVMNVFMCYLSFWHLCHLVPLVCAVNIVSKLPYF